MAVSTQLQRMYMLSAMAATGSTHQSETSAEAVEPASQSASSAVRLVITSLPWSCAKAATDEHRSAPPAAATTARHHHHSTSLLPITATTIPTVAGMASTTPSPPPLL